MPLPSLPSLSPGEWQSQTTDRYSSLVYWCRHGEICIGININFVRSISPLDIILSIAGNSFFAFTWRNVLLVKKVFDESKWWKCKPFRLQLSRYHFQRTFLFILFFWSTFCSEVTNLSKGQNIVGVMWRTGTGVFGKKIEVASGYTKN